MFSWLTYQTKQYTSTAYLAYNLIYIGHLGFQIEGLYKNLTTL